MTDSTGICQLASASMKAVGDTLFLWTESTDRGAIDF
jgi:hypothetical protein